MEDFDKEVEFALMKGLDPAEHVAGLTHEREVDPDSDLYERFLTYPDDLPWESVADAVRSMEADETLIAALRRNGVV
jgi:hypothetical protein